MTQMPFDRIKQRLSLDPDAEIRSLNIRIGRLQKDEGNIKQILGSMTNVLERSERIESLDVSVVERLESVLILRGKLLDQLSATLKERGETWGALQTEHEETVNTFDEMETESENSKCCRLLTPFTKADLSQYDGGPVKIRIDALKSEVDGFITNLRTVEREDPLSISGIRDWTDQKMEALADLSLDPLVNLSEKWASGSTNILTKFNQHIERYLSYVEAVELHGDFIVADDNERIILSGNKLDGIFEDRQLPDKIVEIRGRLAKITERIKNIPEFMEDVYDVLEVMDERQPGDRLSRLADLKEKMVDLIADLPRPRDLVDVVKNVVDTVKDIKDWDYPRTYTFSYGLGLKVTKTYTAKNLPGIYVQAGKLVEFMTANIGTNIGDTVSNYIEGGITSYKSMLAENFGGVRERLKAGMEKLKYRIDAIEHRVNTIERKVSNVKSKIDVLKRRDDA